MNWILMVMAKIVVLWNALQMIPELHAEALRAAACGYNPEQRSHEEMGRRLMQLAVVYSTAVDRSSEDMSAWNEALITQLSKEGGEALSKAGWDEERVLQLWGKLEAKEES